MPGAATRDSVAGKTIAQPQNGSPINLLDAYGSYYIYDDRVDLRLSELSSGELEIALKSTGQVFALTSAVSVPEPASLLLLLPAIGMLGLARRRSRAPA